MIYIKTFESYIDIFDKENCRKIYIDYDGTDVGFEESYNNLIKDYSDGGLRNIPKVVEISRLIGLNDYFRIENNIHWVRREDEYLFYDKDWIFLTDINIKDNPKIIRTTINRDDIDINQSIIQRLTFPSEKEITIKRSATPLSDYEIVDY